MRVPFTPSFWGTPRESNLQGWPGMGDLGQVYGIERCAGKGGNIIFFRSCVPPKLSMEMQKDRTSIILHPDPKFSRIQCYMGSVSSGTNPPKNTVIGEPKYCLPCISFSLHPVNFMKWGKDFSERKEGGGRCPPDGWKEVSYGFAGNQRKEV